MNQEKLDGLLGILQLLWLINQFMKKWKQKLFSLLFILKEVNGDAMWPLVYTGPSVKDEKHPVYITLLVVNSSQSVTDPTTLSVTVRRHGNPDKL